MKTISIDLLESVIGGVDGGACTVQNPTGAPPQQYIGPASPPPQPNPQLDYADKLEHALHGRPSFPGE
ncbi:MAG: hypothetical protein QM831_43775 [Kofleriaceae bacterium]